MSESDRRDHIRASNGTLFNDVNTGCSIAQSTEPILTRYVTTPAALNLATIAVSSSQVPSCWASFNPLVATSLMTFNTNFANVSGISFFAQKNVNYTKTCYIFWQGSAATAGPKYQLTGPTTVSSFIMNLTPQPTYNPPTPVTTWSTGTSGTITNTDAFTASTNYMDTLEIAILAGASSGTVQLQAAAQGVGTLTIQAGSYCK